MKMYHKVILITLGLCGLVGLLAWLWLDYRTVILTFWHQAFDRQRLIDLLRNQGKHNAILFMAVIALGSAIPGMPIAAVAILAGVCFGRWPGFAINVAGIVIGNLLSIGILDRFPHKPQPGKLRALTDRLKAMRHPRVGLSIGYAVPMLPTLLVNYAAMELRMSWWNTAGCILIGSLPVSFLYAFGGNELLFGNTKTAVAAIALVLLLLGLYRVIQRDQRRKGAPAEKATTEEN
ncbi:TVP38/TMEM64 family protein [Levilactobacillus spicheri]|uniref:VTT domain-containing protein n=1 Tax=Levilactobacillus spicheri TaxID=216463 RepID=A0A0F3RUE9_9LACO|nr:VTT domain-containing protein [Levilactobacillus spicheri]KJW13658.1 hypothetical protein VC81_01825 [Levilactobacillus spicheri]